MRKLLLVIGLLLFPSLLWAWTGSDLVCILKYPKGSGATTYVYLPSSVYGIVKNGTSAVDFHFLMLYDTVTGDTVSFPYVQDRNSPLELRILDDLDLIERGKPGISSQYPLEHNAAYVKATSIYSSSFKTYYATDPSKPLTGGWNTTSWISSPPLAPQRFHIDLGTPKIITKIYYENLHHNGGELLGGAKNFTFWGSNSDASFADTEYAHDTGWTQLTTSQSYFDRHVAADTPDPKYITVTNTTPYRYYSFKFVDNYGHLNYIGVRRIELQSDFKIVFGRKYIIYLRAKDIAGLWNYDWGYVYFLPRKGE